MNSKLNQKSYNQGEVYESLSRFNCNHQSSGPRQKQTSFKNLNWCPILSSVTKASSSSSSKERSRVIIILDETGSMQPNKKSTISSYNKFLKSQQKLRKEEINYPKFTLVKFAINATFVESKSIKKVRPLKSKKYNPSGKTALYDAIGDTLDKYWNEHFNTCVIMTDGQENSSKIFNRTDIFKMVQKYTKEKYWEFTYLGANQDSPKVGRSIGITNENKCMNFSADTKGINKIWKEVETRNQDLRSYQAEHREFNSYECNNGTKYISFEKYQRLKKC